MSQVATRLLSLILLLQSQRMWKASELAEELNVSERTVHRYMTMLDEMGIPVYSERGPYGGFSLVRGYKLPPLIFSPEEATVLYMGANLMRQVWGQTYHDAATAATAKLDNVLPDDLRQEVDRAQQRLYVGGLTAIDYRPHGSTIHCLRRCIIERHCVRLCYQSFRQQQTERMVAPYALALRWGLWYLVGHCHLRDALRTFRVDRIHSAEPCGQGFEIPDDFDLEGYMARTMDYEQNYDVVVYLRPRLAPMVREHHGHWMQIDDHDDGAITVRFRTGGLDWATGWVLSLGAEAKVIAPDELAARVRRAAQGVLARYGEEAGQEATNE
jgi:predicted DNA-binding transcriptional regulator YafY